MHDQTGHRQRVKERFRKEGMDSFDEVHALELLLFYALPRVDTKPLARSLLDRFGSFPAVLEASQQELMGVNGVGESVATFIRLLNATVRYYLVRQKDAPTLLDTVEKCKDYLRRQFSGRGVETVFLLCLDAKCNLLNCYLLSEGDLSSAGIPIRRLVELSIASKATAVILAHNHPGGLAAFSPEDKLTTDMIADLLAQMGISLVDHFLYSDTEVVSMVECGKFRPRQR